MVGFKSAEGHVFAPSLTCYPFRLARPTLNSKWAMRVIASGCMTSWRGVKVERHKVVWWVANCDELYIKRLRNPSPSIYMICGAAVHGF